MRVARPERLYDPSPRSGSTPTIIRAWPHACARSPAVTGAVTGAVAGAVAVGGRRGAVLAGIDLGRGGALANGVDGSFCATLEMQFHQDVADVMTGGLCAYEEAFGDLGVAQPLT